MDNGKSILATSFLSALIVLGAAVPLAYYGYLMMDKKITAGQAEISQVVMELKSEALKEIRTASEAGGGAPSSDLTASLSQLSSGVAELQKSVGELRADQQKFAELMQLRTEGLTAAAAVPMPMPVPEGPRPGARDDTFNQTLYFSLGAFQGAKTAKQVHDLVPQILAYAQTEPCTSNVMGFSDTLGGDKSNLDLSLKRAEYVASLLRAKQVPVGTVTGWGERWLDVLTVDGVKNDRNRRVVIETVCHSKPMESQTPSATS